MTINRQNKQLVIIAGGINVLFLLLSIALVIFLGYEHGEKQKIVGKTATFILGNSLCWIVNLCLLFLVVPLLAKLNWPRWLAFYVVSYLITFSLGILIGNLPAYQVISDEPPGQGLRDPITGPIAFVFSINTLSLVAIELILARGAQARIRMENAKMKMENAELRMKSLQAQHEKLKGQLHPHFLFNSLTALKSLIRRDPALAESYLVKLSEFLRFSMAHNEQNVVALQDELKFSLYYLDMQKIRFRNALVFTVDIPGDRLLNARLPVFSLQLALENAIKHNKLTQEQPLTISMRYIEPDWLLVENNIQEKPGGDPASGIGLKNLSDRYKLLVDDDIRIDNDRHIFRVYLKIIRA